MADEAQHPEIGHAEFLQRALVSAGEWTRHADPKALAVLALLGLGVKDLVDHAQRFLHPHEAKTVTCDIVNAAGHTCGGIVATSAFVLAAIVAGGTTILVTHGLFSRLNMRGLLPGHEDESPIKSVFYFGEVARFNTQEAYRAAVMCKTRHELLADLAGQVFEVSKIASDKHRATQRAFLAVLIFLVIWVIARIALATTAV
jgi:hypothetical protein